MDRTGTRDTWGSWYVRRHFTREGCTDEGERAALESVSSLLAEADVLDVGVGGGRTTTLLADRARSYRGIDVSPGMVELAQERHPGVAIGLGDARELQGIDDESADLVLFTNNGIDTVGHDDRPAVLATLHRVLRPGGTLLFSSFNEDGGTRKQRPDLSPLTHPTDRGGLALPAVYAKRALDTALGFWHYRRSRSLVQHGEDWSVVPLRAHEFRFAVHFIRLRAAVAELEAHGFEPREAWAPDGSPVDLAAATTPADYVMYRAVKRA